MTADHKKTPEPTEVNPSALDSLDSASSRQFPIAPFIAHRGVSGQWFLTAVCPMCGGKHSHGGGSGDVIFLNERVADCGGGTYSLVAVDVARWASALGLDEATLRDAVGRMKTLDRVDRRYKLPRGTTALEMVKATAGVADDRMRQHCGSSETTIRPVTA